MKKKRGIFAGRQQTPPAIPPTQISDAKLLADLDVEIAAAERARQSPGGHHGGHQCTVPRPRGHDADGHEAGPEEAPHPAAGQKAPRRAHREGVPA